MIRWLADQNPDVWFALTPRLNWDDATPVLEWIVCQPNCDKTNAAVIFWLSEPDYHVRQLVDGKAPRSEAWQLCETILRNWNSGFYTRSELAWPDSSVMSGIDHFAARLGAVPGGREALNLPKELTQAFVGRLPRLAPEHDPSENPELWDLFYGLGTWCGHRPQSPEWLAERDVAAGQRKQRKREVAIGMFFLSVAAGFAALALFLNNMRP